MGVSFPSDAHNAIDDYTHINLDCFIVASIEGKCTLVCRGEIVYRNVYGTVVLEFGLI